MKKFLFLMAMIVSVTGVYAQDTKVSGPVITFEKKTHDFGTIHQGDKVEQTFTFVNSGNEPLIITNVQVTCGCTTPKGWPRDPIMPGVKGEITIAFNSTGKSGRQDKVVTVVSNAVNADDAKISFTAQVIDKPQ